MLHALMREGAIWQAELTELPASNSRGKADPRLVFTKDGAFLPKGLPLGTTHEWCLKSSSKRVKLCTPISIFSLIINNEAAVSAAIKTRSPRLVFWVGKESFPTPFLIPTHLLPRCIFLDPPTPELKFWAVDAALRSAGTAVVVSSFKSLTLQATQRLALAARHGNAVGLFYRQNLNTPSAATTRWEIENFPAQNDLPCWKVTLLKSKGTHPEVSEWVVDSDGVEHDVVRSSPTLKFRTAYG